MDSTDVTAVAPPEIPQAVSLFLDTHDPMHMGHSSSHT